MLLYDSERSFGKIFSSSPVRSAVILFDDGRRSSSLLCFLPSPAQSCPNMPSALILIADGTEEMELYVECNITIASCQTTNKFPVPSPTTPSSGQESPANRLLCPKSQMIILQAPPVLQLPKDPAGSVSCLIYTLKAAFVDRCVRIFDIYRDHAAE